MQTESILEKVAVTGATGFIGSHLVRALLSFGCSPVLLTRSPEKLAGNIRSLRLDLTDNDSVRDLLLNEKPDTLFHLAGTRSRSNSACNEINFQATARLMEAALRAGVRRVVITGSAEEYGNQQGPLGESLSPQPISAYGISKAMATRHALRMHTEEGLPVVVVRPFSVYGPGQPSNMFVAEAVHSAVRNEPFKMSRGEQKRDLIFVQDVIRGLIAAACAHGVEGKVINLGTGSAHRLRDVAERIWQMSGARSPLLIGARAAGPEELSDTWADTTIARRLLGWEARVNLESGLRQTIEFARKQEEKAEECLAM